MIPTTEQICGALAYADIVIRTEDDGGGMHYVVGPLGAGRPGHSGIAASFAREARIKMAVRNLCPGMPEDTAVILKDKVLLLMQRGATATTAISRVMAEFHNA